MKGSSRGGFSWLCLLISLLLLLPLSWSKPRLSSGCRAVLVDPDGMAEPLSLVQSSAAAAACLPIRRDLWESAAHQALADGLPEAAARYLEHARQEALRFGRPASQALSLQGLQDLAEAYRQTGDFSRAIETWQAIALQPAFSADAAAHIARLYLAQGDFATAADIWQQQVELDPKNASAQYQYASLIATQDPEAALPELEQAASLDPQLQGEVYRLRQAIMGARIADDPAYTLLSAGRAFASSDRWVLAAESFRQAVLQRPDYAEAWAYLGEARQHLRVSNSTDPLPQSASLDGLSELQTALKLDPTSLSAHSFLALYWMRHSRYDLALEAVQKATALSPEEPVLVADLAEIQAASGDLDGAYETFQKAAALAPFDPSYQRRIIRFSLAYHFQVEQVALPLARQLLASEPGNPIDLDLMAQILISQGDLSSARRFLARALAIDPRSAPAHLHLGVVTLLQEDPTAAAEEFRLALSLDPDGPTGLEAQRRLNLQSP